MDTYIQNQASKSVELHVYFHEIIVAKLAKVYSVRSGFRTKPSDSF